jgi:hypothetical protein
MERAIRFDLILEPVPTDDRVRLGLHNACNVAGLASPTIHRRLRRVEERLV